MGFRGFVFGGASPCGAEVGFDRFRRWADLRGRGTHSLGHLAYGSPFNIVVVSPAQCSVHAGAPKAVSFIHYKHV